MSKKTLLQYALPAVITGMLFATVAVSWEEPGNNPPDGNVPAPINVSANNQSKEGWLTIGNTSAPSMQLDVQGIVPALGSLNVSGGAILNTGGAATGLIVANGKVGVGTSTPSAVFHVKGDGSKTGNDEVVFNVNQVIIEDGSAELVLKDTSATSKDWTFVTHCSNKLHISSSDGVSSDGRLTIDGSNGNIGIGDKTPDAKLDVVGNIHYTGTITDVSDIRLKENISPINNALDKITSLEGFRFQMIGEDSLNLGLSAQDVQTVFPEAVSVIESENGVDYLGLDYSQLIAPMIEAIKEQQSQIEELKLEVEMLKK